MTTLVLCGTDGGETTFEFGFATTKIKRAEIILLTFKKKDKFGNHT